MNNFFSFGFPEPGLSYGRLSRHHHPDKARTFSRRKSANEKRQLECQPPYLLKTCFLVGKLVFQRLVFFSFLPSPKLAPNRRQSEYLGNKEIEMGHQHAVSRFLVGHYDILTISWSYT
jgi:hypothetical protein